MNKNVRYAKNYHMVSIKQSKCPKCGNYLERAFSPGGAPGSGKKHPYEYWDFYCINEQCGITWRVPQHLYKATFEEWPE